MRVILYQDLRPRGIPYSREHLRRLIRAGKFPQPIQIGDGRIGWVESEVDALLEARVAERDAGQQPAAAGN